MTTNDDWFAPKAFGYGAGLPVAWQGWALLGVYLGVVLALALTLARTHETLFIALTLIATAVLCVVAARHTRGGWHWRWGGDDA